MAVEQRVDTLVPVKRCPACSSSFGVGAAFCPFDGSALERATWDKDRGDPLVGSTIDGRYEILAPIGEGGMGSVYKVRHIALARQFAIKILREDLASDVDLARRFEREARATAAIKHIGVVAVSDFGVLPDQRPYFVMELLVGETLAARLRNRGPLPPALAIRVAKQIASGLEASHAAQVIHRDLKPDNVFLVGRVAGKAPEDEVRIVDFGAAKVLGKSKLTRPGVVFGTPYYMSPEQASGHPVDGRADVYSLGVLLYEMVTGVVPFEADTYMGVLTKHMFATMPPLRGRMPPGTSLGELEDVIPRAMQKDPAARFPTMSAFVRALEQAEVYEPAIRTRTATPPRTVPLVTMTTADRIQQSVTKRVADEGRRTRRILFIAGLVGLAMVATAASLGIAVARGTRRAADVDHAPPALKASPPAFASSSTTQVASSPSVDPRDEVAPPAEVPAAEVPAAEVSTRKPPPRPAIASPSVAPLHAPVEVAPPVVAPPPTAAKRADEGGGSREFRDPWK